MRQRTIALLALCSAFAVTGYAQSLADLARKEKKRREENQKEVEVMDAAALEERGGAPDDADVATSTDDGLFGDEETSREENQLGALDPDDERAGGRNPDIERLDRIVQSMVRPGQRLVSAAQFYVNNCENASTRAINCNDVGNELLRLAVEVGGKLDSAQTLQRRARILPGRLRSIRAKYGLGDAVWDQMTRYTARFRR